MGIDQIWANVEKSAANHPGKPSHASIAHMETTHFKMGLPLYTEGHPVHFSHLGIKAKGDVLIELACFSPCLVLLKRLTHSQNLGDITLSDASLLIT